MDLKLFDYLLGEDYFRDILNKYKTPLVKRIIINCRLIIRLFINGKIDHDKFKSMLDYECVKYMLSCFYGCALYICSAFIVRFPCFMMRILLVLRTVKRFIHRLAEKPVN